MSQSIKVVSVFLIAGLTTACGQGNGATSSASAAATSAAPAKSASAAPSAAASAKPAVPPSVPKPMEALQAKMGTTKDAHGWPKFVLTNVTDTDVGYVSLWGYAYDKSGKQLLKSHANQNYNGRISAGKPSQSEIEVPWGDKPPPAEATQFEACYDSIGFEGFDDNVHDSKRCPAERPLGGVK